MDWIGRMNEVLQYVEENLENSIQLIQQQGSLDAVKISF